MRPTRHRTDPYRPTDHHCLPPPVATSLALTVAIPLAIYLLSHPGHTAAVVLTAATTARLVHRGRPPA